MLNNHSYGTRSLVTGLVALATLILLYGIAPENPQGIMVVIMSIILIISIICFIISFVNSIKAIKNKEMGIKKYSGVLFPILVMLYFILIPILMAILFILND